MTKSSHHMAFWMSFSHMDGTLTREVPNVLTSLCYGMQPVILNYSTGVYSTEPVYTYPETRHHGTVTGWVPQHV